ncbi:MAG: type II toxin-antitoxin system VapC family toxin [Longimicrobiaceae bacterium]
MSCPTPRNSSSRCAARTIIAPFDAGLTDRNRETLGFDTGFFVRLLESDPRAAEIWQAIEAGEVAGVISCITLFELIRIGLRGALSRESTEELTQLIPGVCTVVWLTEPTLLHDAARLAHGHHFSMADAVILISLRRAGADTIYTTDADLVRYRRAEIRRL